MGLSPRSEHQDTQTLLFAGGMPWRWHIVTPLPCVLWADSFARALKVAGSSAESGPDEEELNEHNRTQHRLPCEAAPREQSDNHTGPFLGPQNDHQGFRKDSQRSTLGTVADEPAPGVGEYLQTRR